MQGKLGGKAFGLKQLCESGIVVPEFIVLSAEDVRLILHNEERFETFFQDIQIKFGHTRLAIRSSANKEDGENKSYAGFFTTVLNVRIARDTLKDAIQKVYNSGMRDINSDIVMNVIVQKMITPLIAGVCFTEAFGKENEKYCLFSFVKGYANKLVDGKVKATQIAYRYINRKLGRQDIIISGNLVNYVKYIQTLLPIIDKIRSHIYQNADIEWCIDKNGKPWILQVRKITKKIRIFEKSDIYSIVSEGVVSGKAYYIDSSLETKKLLKVIEQFPENGILVSEYTDTMFMPAIKKSKGIITQEGDILSHSAITSRELEIPCLVGVSNLKNKIKTGDDIYINTTKNILEVNKKQLNMQGNTGIDWSAVYYFDNIIELKVKNKVALLESKYNQNLLYHGYDICDCELSSLKKMLENKINNRVHAVQNNKYHWYFEWKNFCKLKIFKFFEAKAKNIAQTFDSTQVVGFYNEVIEECCKLKFTYNSEKNKRRKLILNEEIISLYFLLDMFFPQGLCIYHLYCKSLSQLNEKSSFSFWFGKNKDKKTAEFIKEITNSRNNIFNLFLGKELLSYEFMSERDNMIRELFANKYPKYSPKMYELFYKKYIINS